VGDIAYEMMKEIQVQYIISTTAKAENITGLDQFQDCSELFLQKRLVETSFNIYVAGEKY
jgi:hypothetical protein